LPGNPGQEQNDLGPRAWLGTNLQAGSDPLRPLVHDLESKVVARRQVGGHPLLETAAIVGDSQARPIGFVAQFNLEIARGGVLGRIRGGFLRDAQNIVFSELRERKRRALFVIAKVLGGEIGDAALHGFPKGRRKSLRFW
jgi:hypothetical protein